MVALLTSSLKSAEQDMISHQPSQCSMQHINFFQRRGVVVELSDRHNLPHAVYRLEPDRYKFLHGSVTLTFSKMLGYGLRLLLSNFFG